MFTSLDKALIDRTVRGLQEVSTAHKALYSTSGAWSNSKEGHAAKRRYDALARDAADLKALSQRMINEVGDSSVEKYRKTTKSSVISGALSALPDAPIIKLGEPLLTSNPGPAVLRSDDPATIFKNTDFGIVAVTEVPGAKMTDWEADAMQIGAELEPFEQLGKPAGAPSDLADQAAVVVGDQG